MKTSIAPGPNQAKEAKDSFDFRMVRYEYIHSIRDEFFDELFKISNPKSGENILDVGCGYGSVTREILKRSKNKTLNCSLADSNYTQLLRAKTELTPHDIKHNSKLKFFIDNLVNTRFEENTFDTVIAKMVIHEIQFKKQQKAIQNAFKILKPKGKLIIWDMALNEKTQMFIQDIIRMKDKLAGFKTLEKNRYFLRFDEIKNLLDTAGFTKITKAYQIVSPVITHKRLEQEFGNDKVKLEKWHDFIRERSKKVEPAILKYLKFKDEGGTIFFIPPKAIITAIK